MSEADQLARKKRVRAGHRASTTRILGQVEPSINADPLDGARINQLKRSLEKKLQSLGDLDRDILEITPDDSIDAEIVQADEMKERIYAALPRLDRCLSLTRPSGRTTPMPDPPATDPPDGDVPPMDPAPAIADPPASSVVTQGARVKLPKISLPRFNGNPIKWTAFWDSYESAIHLNRDLSEVDKFNYLRSILDGTASDAVAGLTLSSANYQQAIEILRKRFGNKQVIISKHMDTLMSMEAISSDRHLKDLRQLYDNTESHVRSLKSLGIEPAAYGALLSPVLLSKLPPELRLIVSRKVSDSKLDMDALLATFEEELTARERANTLSARRSQERTHHTASTLFSGSNTAPQCSYCQQSHSSAKCSTVTDIASRKHILKTSGHCFNCLRRNHVSRECKSSSRCLRCKKNTTPPSATPIPDNLTTPLLMILILFSLRARLDLH